MYFKEIKRKNHFLYLPFPMLFISSFDPVFIWYNFPSAWIISFSISCNANLLVISSVCYLLSKKKKALAFILSYSCFFLHIEFLVVFFHCGEDVVPCLWAFIIFYVYWVVVPLYVISLYLLSDLSWPLIFSSLVVMW